MENINKAIKEKQEYEKRMTDYIDKLRKRSDHDMLVRLAEYRKFPLSILEDSGIFYIGDMAEMLLPDYLDELEDFGVISPVNKKPIFQKRYLIPIKTVDGLVQNVVGYSSDADERYIFGNAKYYRRKDTLWGLENLHLAYQLGYAILTEGITDAIRLRSMGYKNTFAMSGTHSSRVIMRQLNRCRHGIIRIPDRDSAGLRALKNWNVNRHLTLYVALNYKDVDEMCRYTENQEWFNGYAKDCINWILSDTHKGNKCSDVEVTII